jgi:hypothetical protein
LNWNNSKDSWGPWRSTFVPTGNPDKKFLCSFHFIIWCFVSFQCSCYEENRPQ